MIEDYFELTELKLILSSLLYLNRNVDSIEARLLMNKVGNYINEIRDNC